MAENYTVQFGKRLRAMRGKKRWSQLRIAQKAGVCQETIRRLEAGELSRLRASTVEAIAAVFPELSM